MKVPLSPASDPDSPAPPPAVVRVRLPALKIGLVAAALSMQLGVTCNPAFDYGDDDDAGDDDDSGGDDDSTTGR